MLKRGLILGSVMALVSGATQSWAVNSNAGEAGANFLKISVSARASAMGEVFGAIADDISSIYYNPAGLTQIKQKTLGVMHTDWLQEVNYEFLAYTEPYREDKAFGVALSYLGMSEMKMKDINNETLGDFGAQDLALSIAYAQKIKGKIYAGATLKFIQQKLEEEISSSTAIDIGLLTKRNALSFGACLSNLGTKVKFIKDEESLPLNLKMGIAYKLLDNRVTVGLDINKPIDNDINFGVGAEYQVINNLFVRAGYNSKNDLGNGLSLGSGFKVGNLQVDYCFLPYEQLGDVHRFSLQFKHNEPQKRDVELFLPPVEMKQPLLENATISTTKQVREENAEKELKETMESKEISKETMKSEEVSKESSKSVAQWIKGNKYKVTAESLSGGKRVWLKIGNPESKKTYLLEKETQVEYLGEEKKGFYKVVVTTEGAYKGMQGWIWGRSFEKIED